jgi:DNA-binding CsgD family transcriptional regulator
MGVVGKIAAVAAEQDTAFARAEQVLDELTDLIPYAAADFAAIDPVSGDFVQLARRGYTEVTLAGLRHTKFLDTVDLLGLRTSGKPTRMRDVPGDPLDTWVIGEVLVPAGYREGLTMCLRTKDGRVTGVINLSTESPDDPTDLATESIGFLCHALGSVADLTQSNKWIDRLSSDNKTAVGLDTTGNVISFSGTVDTDLFHPKSELVQAIKDFVRENISGSFIWPANKIAAGCFKVSVIPVSNWIHDLVAVITIETANVESLSHRELEVLTLAARGLSNREIADVLFISDRTVQTHIEHTLVKLSAPNRAAAAAAAVRRGLLLGPNL